VPGLLWPSLGLNPEPLLPACDVRVQMGWSLQVVHWLQVDMGQMASNHVYVQQVCGVLGGVDCSAYCGGFMYYMCRGWVCMLRVGF
jgi:hypothetical protein